MADDDEIIEDDPKPPASAAIPEAQWRKRTFITYTDTEIKHAMTVAEGNLSKVAMALRLGESALYKRVQKSRELRAAWHLLKTQAVDADKPAGPTMQPGEMNTRNAGPKKIGVTPEFGEGRAGAPPGQLANEVATQDMDILTNGGVKMDGKADLEILIDGMEQAGILPQTVEKLRNLSSIKLNTGMFLVTSLDLIHRTMIRQAIGIFEEADHMRKTYLRDIQLAEADRQGWMRLYIEICDQLGKASDRILAGTQALVQIHGGGEKPKSRGKNRSRGQFQEQSEAPDDGDDG